MGDDRGVSGQVIPLVVVSPVRDEAAHLHRTIDAMVAQTWRPAEWLIVDDGSTDSTLAVIEAYRAEHPWIRVLSRPDRGERVLGSGVVGAFLAGLAALETTDYQWLAKVDGDMSFPPRYLEVMVGALQAEPRLAAVSGKVFRPEGAGLVEEFTTDRNVAGQFKLYRRTAYEQIGGFTPTILWDGIDIHRCLMHGWETRSWHDDDARLTHHRLMGSSDRSVLVGRRRLGRGLWFMGYHPLYAVASGLFRMHEKPRGLGGLLIVGSYLAAMLRREPQLPDPVFRAHLRHWQLQQLRELVVGAVRNRRLSAR